MFTAAGLVVPAEATAAPTPIGRLGETLRIEVKGIVADITVHSIDPSPVPPGFGHPPRPPRHQVWRAWVTVHTVQAPNPYAQSITYQFRGVTPTGDAYEPRITDAPDDLQRALQNAPAGSTVSGAVFWDCYRDLVSNVVLLDKATGYHLAQWNV
ncbi:hypothetical protein C731_1927 [Mycolicibacterium hassiacum DSM 44199]|uniref:Exported alanine and valine rich protein n=1 Tax=Mycolicibacterium hassiacum (strain DSM 44199 / CIP 105218 / JCM 12690 / 3849) TaxID=1122247 RepID=K5BFT0_MYCHD|nr:hypothetical protein C731_1927 [Mycolicibacterium hassiacum DSM 44199]